MASYRSSSRSANHAMPIAVAASVISHPAASAKQIERASLSWQFMCLVARVRAPGRASLPERFHWFVLLVWSSFKFLKPLFDSLDALIHLLHPLGQKTARSCGLVKCIDNRCDFFVTHCFRLPVPARLSSSNDSKHHRTPMTITAITAHCHTSNVSQIWRPKSLDRK